jgi:spermidine synthase
MIYFFSGVCSLIDEVIWVRLLKLTLGNTVYASSIVVSMFMGGLALGALIMARYADRVKRRLRLYAILEICATMSALALPFVLRFVDGGYRWFYINYHPSPRVLLLVQVFVSALVLLVPAMLMGSTLPLLGRYVTGLKDRVGHLVGRLYALNMLGAMLGCFLAGFVLIRFVGVMGSLYIAAAINLLVALGGWIISRYHDRIVESDVKASQTFRPKAESGQPAAWKNHLLLLACFSSGLISIGYELIWMRSVVFLVGGYTYVFSAVLTIYLLGNVIGVSIGSRLSKRIQCPAWAFGISLTCLGMFGVFYIPLFKVWHSIAPNIFSMCIAPLFSVEILQLLLPIFNSVFLFLLPAIMMGIGFPFALQAWSNYRHDVGRTTGTVYGVNTIGAVLGGLLTGFVLIPFFGVQLSIVILGLLGIWLGMTMAQAVAGQMNLLKRTVYIVVAAGLTLVTVIIPSDMFERRIVRVVNTRQIAAKDGVTTTVSVHESDSKELLLATSGIKVAGDSRSVFRVPQKLLGHLGVLLNKNAREVITVGFGSGETTACLSRHDLDQVDCVEIAPELVEMSLQYFNHINLGDDLDKHINVIYMDAKNYMHLTDRRYDLIVSDCINPKQFAENASLFTKEYFQDSLERLSPGGIFGTYLPVTEMPISCTDSALGTFTEVFPYVTIWFPLTAPGDYDFWFIAGSKEPQRFSPNHIDTLLAQKNIHDSTSYINYHNSHYVFNCYLGDQDDLKRYLGDYNLNSDYMPFLEFDTAMNETRPVKKKWFNQFLTQSRRDSLLKYIDWSGMSAAQQEKWLKQHQLYYKAASYLWHSRIVLVDYYSLPQRLSVLRNCYNGLKILPDHSALLEEEETCINVLKMMMASGEKYGDVLASVDELLQREPAMGTAWLVKSWCLQRYSQIQSAVNAAEKAMQYSPNDVRIQSNLGRCLIMLGQFDAAIAHYRTVRKLQPEYLGHMNDLAWLLATCGNNESFNPNEAVQIAEQACKITNYNNPTLLDTLAAAYAAADRFPEAVTTAKKAIKIAQASGEENTVREIQTRLSLYNASKPYVENN